MDENNQRYTNEQKITDALNEIAEGVPHAIRTDRDGKVIGVTYEKKWKVGGTTPVEDDDGNVLRYETNYTNRTLTEKQISEIDNYISTLS